jgi:hypothetical protein
MMKHENPPTHPSSQLPPQSSFAHSPRPCARSNRPLRLSGFYTLKLKNKEAQPKKMRMRQIP